MTLLRRRNFLSHILERPLLVTGFLGIIAVALASIAWFQLDYSVADSIYRGVRVLGSGDEYADTNLWCVKGTLPLQCETNTASPQTILLHIARYLGVIFIFSAVFAGVVALFSTLVGELRVRLGGFKSVIIGNDPLCAEALRHCNTRSSSVLYLGADKLTLKSKLVASPWPPDATRADVLGRAISSAESILIVNENDMETLADARAALVAILSLSKTSDRSLTVLFHSRSVLREARQILLSNFYDGHENRKHLTVRFIAIGAMAARSLALAHPPYKIATTAA